MRSWNRPHWSIVSENREAVAWGLCAGQGRVLNRAAGNVQGDENVLNLEENGDCIEVYTWKKIKLGTFYCIYLNKISSCY